MFTSAFRDTLLAQLGGFVGLLTAITDWRAGTVTEASYTGYGTRPAITWDTAENTSPAGGRQVKSSGAITFPANSGSDQAVIAWAIYAASTGGSPQAIGLLDTDSPIAGVGNVDDSIDAYAHGLVADQRVFVMAAPGLLLPAGLSENVAYFVLASGLTADVFKLSTSSGGSAVNVTVGGAALFIPYTARTIAAGATPQFADDQIVVQI
jgi:hypothetical protein